MTKQDKFYSFLKLKLQQSESYWQVSFYVWESRVTGIQVVK